MLFDITQYWLAQGTGAVGGQADLRPGAILRGLPRAMARMARVPAVVVDFLDPRLHWARSIFGIAGRWTQQDYFLWRHLLEFDGLMAVRCLRRDPRFENHPLLMGTPRIHTCLSVPVLTPGRQTLGTFHLLDYRVRRWKCEDVNAVQELAEFAGRILLWWLQSAEPPGSSATYLARGQLYRELFENSADVVYAQDLRGVITVANGAAERLLGYGAGELVGVALSDLIVPEDCDRARHMVLEQFGGGVPQRYSLGFRARDGRRIVAEVTAHLLFERGQPVGLLGFGREITGERTDFSAVPREPKAGTGVPERFRTLHRLFRSPAVPLAELFSSYLSAGCRLLNLPVGIVAEIQGDDFEVRAVHGNAGASVGDVAPLRGTRFSSAVRSGQLRTHTSEQPVISKAVFANQGAGLLICAPVLAGGRTRAVVAFGSRKPQGSPGPQLRATIELMAAALGRAIVEADMWNLVAVQQQLALRTEREIRQDPLTRLPTGRCVTERLEPLLRDARAANRYVALMLLDFDRFRQVNNALGHASGDALLQSIASRLIDVARPGDLVGRMGSDQFVVVLPDLADTTAAESVSTRILDAIRRPFTLNGLELFVTASAGVSLFPKDGDDAAALFWSADCALCLAKSNGRNDLRYYRPRGQESGLQLLELESSLHRALERSQFEIRYEPLVAFDGAIRGWEALLSWRHPVRGLMPAEQFIPIAEVTGVIIPVGAWVLEQACRDCAGWNGNGAGELLLAVNVSAVQLAQPGFLEVVQRALRHSGIPPQRLELEVTESALIRDLAGSISVMQQLRSLGVRIAIDDFGIGYSSLSYLQRLPADTLKIDKSFLHLAESPAAALPMIRAIVSLAHGLGLAVVMEGVETNIQWGIARRAGCDLVQGHFFGRALERASVERVVESGKKLRPPRYARRGG